MRDVVDRPWRTVRQVHGSRVVTVDASSDRTGDADALVTTDPSVAIAVRTADCPAIALVSDEGVAAVAHAGWRSLVAGVVEATVDVMRERGATRIAAALGPHIGPECYEFSPADIDRVARSYGACVRATSSGGAPALDLGAGVRAALARRGVALAHDVASCTACDADRWYSHRARREPERLAAVVWLQ